MTTRNALTKLFTYWFLPAVILLVQFVTPSFAANFPLEITNIKPSGTGTPAIPATNRIFRAYPGIEYNIRAAVIGGLYPFAYKLENAPAGMTIKPSTGEIIWPNPQANSGTITLSVTDSEKTTVSTNWAITVTTNGFLFVDASYTGTETGTITQPFSSVASFLQKTNAANIADITYFRGGTYTLIEFGNTFSKPGDVTGKYGTNLKDSSYSWIGYPGETVSINGDGRQLVSPLGLYFDNLNLSDFSDYGMEVISKNNYMTMRRCNWSKIVAVNSVNENQGFIFTWDGGTGYYLVLQDNSFSDFTGTSAIGSLYSTHKALIENNHIFNPGGPGISSICNGIAAKIHTDYLTVRGNKIIMHEGTPFGNSLNAMMKATSYVEICFNFIARTTTGTGRAAAHYFNPSGISTEDSTKNLSYYRNTVIGDFVFSFIDGLNCSKSGPFKLSQNVVINRNIDWAGHYYASNHLAFIWGTAMDKNPQTCISVQDNLMGTEEDGIVDAEGRLTPSFNSYLGTHGHQIAPPAPKLIKINITD